MLRLDDLADPVLPTQRYSASKGDKSSGGDPVISSRIIFIHKFRISTYVSAIVFVVIYPKLYKTQHHGG